MGLCNPNPGCQCSVSVGTGLTRTGAGSGSDPIVISPVIVGCRVYLDTGTISIPNTTVTVVSWTLESFDTHSIHSASSNTSRFTIPVGFGGLWRFDCNLLWDENNTSGVRSAFFRVNGDTNHRLSQVINTPTTNGAATHPHDVINLSAGDYVEVCAFQTSGSARTIRGNSPERVSDSHMSATFIGAM